jgi:dihydrofolate reductase
VSARVALIAARAANGVIGRNGDLPWGLPSDLRHFKAVTMGKPIVMGRKTWDSLPKRPLPGRANIVVSRDPAFQPSGAWAFSEPEVALHAALAQAQAAGVAEIVVIGGASLYAHFLQRADRLYLTDVDAAPDGDVFFPQFDATEFSVTDRKEIPAGNGDQHACVVRVLDRL